MSINKLRVFETFSGIGAQHKALEIIKNKFNFDYEIVATSEWDVDACIAYAAIHYPNFENLIKNESNDNMNRYFSKFEHSFTGKSVVNLEKIIAMEESRKIKYYKAHLITKNMGSILSINGKELYKKIGNIDLITYSFPCQDLSMAGSFHGFNKGMGKGDGTRSGLLWEIGRILLDLKKIKKLPKFLLLENVPNMISPKHLPDYISWKKELLNIGYQTKTYVINAKEYGLPQNRKRVYAISINGKYKVNDNLEIIDEFIFPKKLERIIKKEEEITLKNIIKEDYSNKTHREEAEDARPNKTPSRKKMFYGNYILNNYDECVCSRTVTTKQDRHPNAGVINLKNTILETTDGKKANYRFITPREAYLLMGFGDDDFNRVKLQNIRKDKLYQQAGNSIAVTAISVILKKIQEIYND